MFYTVLYDKQGSQVDDMAFEIHESDNLDRKYEKYEIQYKENCTNTNNNDNNNYDMEHIEKYVIKNDQKYIEALFEKYIEKINQN